MDDQQDFVSRQYASLMAGGLSAEAAQARVGEVLGETALRWLAAAHHAVADGRQVRGSGATRVMAAATRLGGNAANAHAAFSRATDEARLLALDWWRPIRTFLLYIVALLALAVFVAIIFALHVLPAFDRFNASLRPIGHAAPFWDDQTLRVFGPLILIAILLVVLAAVWFRMRQRMAQLEPFAGLTRWPWLYGRGGEDYHAMLCLEYASALHAGGVADAALLEPALHLAGWTRDRPLCTRRDALGEKLEQAQRLGTFDAELEWQRRLYWSRAQSRLELARDRLTLASRVIFYVLIGYMVTVLYLPIFSIASMFGVHA